VSPLYKPNATLSLISWKVKADINTVLISFFFFVVPVNVILRYTSCNSTSRISCRFPGFVHDRETRFEIMGTVLLHAGPMLLHDPKPLECDGTSIDVGWARDGNGWAA